MNIEQKYNNSPYRIPLKNKDKVILDYSIVDEDDYKNVMKYKWHLSNGYANAKIDRKNVKLHHFINGKPTENNITDHINQDKLDNRKCNLREVNRAFNSQNVSKTSRNHTSIFKGVSWDKTKQKFRVMINQQHLGYFENEKEAALMYDIVSFHYYGEYANNNNLIQYSEAINQKLDNIIKKKQVRKHYDLPQNIRIFNNKYRADKSYNGIQFNIKLRDTIEEATEDLIDINIKINHYKCIEELKSLHQKIIRNKDDIAIIMTTNKKHFAFVDDNNWHRLSQIDWHVCNGYFRNVKIGYLHKYILKSSFIVDHINNNKFDNRINNLRIASTSLNNHNRTKSKKTSSKYIGVYFNKSRNKFRAQIQFNHKAYHLGCYDTEEDAARAYNRKATEFYGVDANINVIP